MRPPDWQSDDGAIRLYCGDCLELLPTMEAGEVDAVVTDPPYGIVNKFADQNRPNRKGTRKLSWSWDDAKGVEQAISITCELASSAFVFVGLDTADRVQSAMRENGMTPKPFAWVKKHPPPAMPGNWWSSGFELAVFGYKPRAWFGYLDQPMRPNVITHDGLRHGNSEKSGHPTQKPLGVILNVVNGIVPPDGVAIDPFMGSATTGVACVQTGRRFIGMEISEEYFAIAVKRITAAIEQHADGPMFKHIPDPQLFGVTA